MLTTVTFRDPTVYDFPDFPLFSQPTKKNNSVMFNNSVERQLLSLELLKPLFFFLPIKEK